MHNALEPMNLKLTEVLTDVTGLTGLSIVKAILDGQRNPVELVRLRHPQCAKEEAEFAKALEGTWGTEHVFDLKQASELFLVYPSRITDCDSAD